MTILITGASGFIGGYLYDHLSKNHKVYRVLRNYKDDGDDRIFYIDLVNLDDVKYRINDSNEFDIEIDIIIHCAAILADSKNSKNIDLFNDNNRITESVISIAKKCNVKRVINFSTIGLYPNKDGTYNETSQVNPAFNAECLYSLSKFCSEELLTFLLPNVSIINLRLSQTHGKGMRNDRIYALFINELRTQNTITLWGNGERSSNFISVEYLLSQIDHILVEFGIKGTFNIGQKNMTYLELANQIVEVYGNEKSRIVLIDKGVKSKVYIDCNKLETELNK
jgi:nucleoside-diphosphate-sugar epimerase